MKTNNFNAEKLMLLVDWLRQQGTEALSGKPYKQISAEVEKELGFTAPESTLHRIRTTESYKVTWSTSKPHFDTKRIEAEQRKTIERLDFELRAATANIKLLAEISKKMADRWAAFEFWFNGNGPDSFDPDLFKHHNRDESLYMQLVPHEIQK